MVPSCLGWYGLWHRVNNFQVIDLTSCYYTDVDLSWKYKHLGFNILYDYIDCRYINFKYHSVSSLSSTWIKLLYYILSFESPCINSRISSNPFLLFRCDISFNTKRFSSHITTVFGKGLLTITHKQRTKDGLIKFCNNWLIFAILVTL